MLLSYGMNLFKGNGAFNGVYSTAVSGSRGDAGARPGGCDRPSWGQTRVLAVLMETEKKRMDLKLWI